MKKRMLAVGLTMMLCLTSAVLAEDTQDAAAKTPMNPGTYTATGSGMNGDIEVEVEVSEDAIVSAAVISNVETAGIGSPLLDSDGNAVPNGDGAPTEVIPERVVKAQSLGVDGISGATITSAVIKNLIGDCISQAGGNPDEWKDEVITEEPKQDAEADVVVVGGGGAGLAAAISAEQNGASVIVIEKNGEIGGDTLVCGGIYNTPDEDLQSKVEMTDSVKQTLEAALEEEPVSDEHAELQAEVQAQWDQYQEDGRTDLFDTKEWYALQTWNGGDKIGDLNLVKELAYNAYDDMKWIETLGVSYTDVIGQGAGSLWQRTHNSTMQMGTGMISNYAKYIDASDKIQLICSSRATQLVKDDAGKVVAVKAVDQDGNEFTVTANMGVVLSTGGFSANGKMVQEYNTSGKWDDLSKVPTTNRFTCSQGDGITMATEIGASLTDMDQIQLLYLGNTKDGTMTKYPATVLSGTDEEIFVNKEGKRFVREDGRRDEICLAVLSQPDAMFYSILSSDGTAEDIENGVSADGFSFQYLIDNEYIYVGDTLEELAEKIGVDAAVLQETVDSFNASVESGKDEFGRTLYSTKLENGPWIATPRQASVHHTMGGVTIDTDGHVLDEEGNIIEGLVAAGEVTGGVHGANRLGGNAVVDTAVFGKKAGETITGK